MRVSMTTHENNDFLMFTCECSLKKTLQNVFQDNRMFSFASTRFVKSVVLTFKRFAACDKLYWQYIVNQNPEKGGRKPLVNSCQNAMEHCKTGWPAMLHQWSVECSFVVSVDFCLCDFGKLPAVRGNVRPSIDLLWFHGVFYCLVIFNIVASK